MSKKSKLLDKLANFQSDANWTMDELVLVLTWHGFVRVGGEGSHRVFTRPGYPQAVVLAAHGNKIKTGYVRAVREHLAALKLQLETETENPK